jgi:ABC-type glycerol-3-phosphate transport system substrate-binding protein
MEPRITAPPFVRALEELAAAAHAAGDVKVQLQLTPSGVRDAFLSGRAAMALGWPTAADSTATDSAVATPATANRSTSQSVPIGFVELPGSPEMFNPRDQRWQPRNADTERQVPLLGIAGRMGSVVQEAAALEPATSAPATPGSNAAAEPAFELLVWLSTKPWDRQICPASPATTLFRRSQIAEANRWVEASIDSAAARQYADVEARSCSRSQWVDALRLPGQAEYMAALDDAVRRTASGELAPQKALATAADRWREITTRRGLDAQRDAYSHSLGLER